ncbi:MAG: SpoIIE family protein phosphatase [Vicinamibacterales bacterium]
MDIARLEIREGNDTRHVVIDKPAFAIGRRTDNDLCLANADISRDHAEIIQSGGRYTLRDRGSRFGTFVNGKQVTEHELKSMDAIRLGRSGGVELVFLLGEAPAPRNSTTVVSDLHQLGVLLESLRALGSGRVLDDVLALVIDSAIAVSGAERGFILLEGENGQLETKLGRGRGGTTLPDETIKMSRKIPEQVFATGQTQIVADLPMGELADLHQATVVIGIRDVLCVPLKLVRFVDKLDAAGSEPRQIGVLYLDSHERGSIITPAAASSVEALATEAAVAIENARLYRSAIEKARLEEEMKIAAKIQQMLVPQTRRTGAYFDAVGATLPCRAIGGDFFDYVDLPSGGLGFTVADVAGKGAPAALLTAVLQGGFSVQASFGSSAAETLSRLNHLLLRRSIDARFATMLYAMLEPDGRLTYCNAGHNPPFLLRSGKVERLEKGGLILGLFEHATYEEETLVLEPGDLVVLFSDGVSEAFDPRGDEFGEDRILKALEASRREDPPAILERLTAAVRRFSAGAAQSDDLTVLIVRYLGGPSSDRTEA